MNIYTYTCTYRKRSCMIEDISYVYVDVSMYMYVQMNMYSYGIHVSIYIYIHTCMHVGRTMYHTASQKNTDTHKLPPSSA